MDGTVTKHGFNGFVPETAVLGTFLFDTTTNFASKREQCQTCLSMAEREQSQDRDSGINYTN